MRIIGCLCCVNVASRMSSGRGAVGSGGGLAVVIAGGCVPETELTDGIVGRNFSWWKDQESGVMKRQVVVGAAEGREYSESPLANSRYVGE